MNVVEKLGMYGLVPVAAINDSKDAVPLAKALIEGGLPVIEVTMRTEAGLDCIRKILEVYPDMLVGAGTVLTLDKCKEAVAAGAKYIVAPGFNEEIVAWCCENGVPITPGVTSPTEIDKALSYGLKIIKFFPADVYGGIKGCASLYAPYKSTGIKFMPTGGISEANMADYVSKPFIHAVGGSWLCRTADIDAGNFDKIRELTASAMKTMMGFEVVHSGIYCEGYAETDEVAADFAKAFGFQINKLATGPIFASKDIEIMTKSYGDKGHIAIGTNSIERAIFYLESRGYAMKKDSLRYDAEGRPSFGYLEKQFGGYGIHLNQK